MTERVYMEDSYLKTYEAKVKSIQENKVILEKTIFHPNSGGLTCDLGKIYHLTNSYDVINVWEDETANEVVHFLNKVPSLKENEIVKMEIDWDRRYKIMKLHTAAHIISSIMYKKYNALITGGHIEPEIAKDDFSTENFNKAIAENVIDEVNEIISKNIPVKIYYLSREEALKIKGIVKLAERTPPNLKELRIVEIPGVDIQADGGPHVKNTSEIGRIVLSKVENKGKNRKRFYYKLQE